MFSVESLAKVAGVKPRDKDIKRLTNYSMQTIYNHFKREVIEQEYHYNLVPLGKKQDKNDIEVIKMGDVRHLAIINLMMMGYNPLYIKELAGHRDLDTQMGYYNHIDTLASAKSHVLKDMIKRFNTELELNTYQSGEYVVQKKILGAAYYDLPLVFDGKGRCKSTDFPNSCVTLECIFCPHFIPDKNLSKDYYNTLHEKNRKDLEALKMELKLFVLGSIDNRTFEKLGKKIGITLNKEIMIEAYTHLQEETE